MFPGAYFPSAYWPSAYFPRPIPLPPDPGGGGGGGGEGGGGGGGEPPPTPPPPIPGSTATGGLIYHPWARQFEVVDKYAPKIQRRGGGRARWYGPRGGGG